MNRYFLALGWVAVVLFGYSLTRGTAEEVKFQFALSDVRTEKLVSLSDFKSRKAVVLVFIGTSCPLSNLYLPKVEQLRRDYPDVAFLGINSNDPDNPAKVAKHAKDYDINFPVLKDHENRVADQFGIRRTPEVVVLDSQRQVVYQGRIDDQHAIDVNRAKPTSQELRDALDAVLAGKLPLVRRTEPAGCKIGRRAKPKPDAQLTYHEHVAAIVQKHCVECHRAGQIGPMSLGTFDEVAGWADMIAEVVRDQRMPPWYADPSHGKFQNDRRLTDDERRTLLGWIEQGCAEGDSQKSPAPRTFPDTWQIGKPDLILTMNEEFEVPAQMPRFGIPYKYFTVDPGFTEDKWVERAEARAGATSVVHHIIMFIVPPGNVTTAGSFPRLLPGVRNASVLVGTAPGDMPSVFPPGVARKIPAGSKLLFQMHYTPNGKAAKDRSSVGLIFAKSPPKYEAATHPVFNDRFRIPAGAENYRVDSYYTFQKPAKILGFMPHMHLRGKSFAIEVMRPGSVAEPVLTIPRYNFNWQNVYRFQEPLSMPAGSRVHCVAHYDNSKQNPNNPDPNKTVNWGDQTWEEMMIGWMDFYYDQPIN